VKKILYVSGSLGLGHVTRDMAIAKAMRAQRLDLEIVWLSSPPASLVLEQAGETLVTGSADYQKNTAAIEESSDGFRVNLLNMIMRQTKEHEDEFERFRQIAAREDPDVVVGDEASEIAFAMAKGELMDLPPIVMIFDFIKWYPMSASPKDHFVSWMVNRNGWHKAYKNRAKWSGKGRTIFLGEMEDIPDERLGLGLVNARKAAEITTIVGEVIRFDPRDYSDIAAVRKELGYGPGPLVVCSVGGTSIGRPLLELCAKAFELARDEIPGLRMVLVAGPRVDVSQIPMSEGLEIMAYVPDLYKHFAASDLAIVQCGGTTTLELLALQKPFIYFPLEEHFEQRIAVAGKLKRYGATNEMRFYNTTPEMLASAMKQHIGQRVSYKSINTGAEKKIAEMVSSLLEPG
jgi:UDP-N-acetylglucosamine:LPS N-acetylglucosamine transferase